VTRPDYLYETIAEAVRQQILRGDLKPGDRMPTVRQMTERWGCTPGTAQRAYRELARQGLVTSRQGQGTFVSGPAAPAAAETPLRRAELVHRAEAFLLEAVGKGFSSDDIEQAVTFALDRWRSASTAPGPAPRRTLRFVGSHDLALDWLAAHFGDVAAGYRLDVHFAGSLGGLIALAQGDADIAGSHLWDEETGAYNEPFVRRLLPGRRVALITLAQRRVGLIVAADNPHRVRGLRDLARPGLRFVNRQSGSGTRVWLDSQLRRLGISPVQVAGYERVETTHSAVARQIAEGEADVGLGLEAAAAAYGLGFVGLMGEPYQLVVPSETLARAPARQLAAWLKSRKAKAALGALDGYDAASSGTLTWVD
jgi:molybdate-binding protein/DNA-binding transcriptional regulator YhcF (GntR family)